MHARMLLAVFGVCVLSAQTPNFSGVWKADLGKSKLNGPAPSDYLMILEQQDGKLVESVGVYTQRGEQRSKFTFKTDGSPSINSFHGQAMRTQASWSGGTLVLDSKVAAEKPGSVNEKYSLSPDGKTLTVETAISMGGREMQQTLVLEKQPDSAGEALRKPEQTAGTRFKNVQLLKDLPASQFLDAMRSFNTALGVECGFCHVQGKFDSDEKPTKLMARKMLTMTHTINETTFGGKMEVRCYTCHQGHEEPHSHPSF